MAIKNKKDIPPYPIMIDLTGPDGNVFVLMGKAKRFARDLGLDGDEIIKDMMSSDYEHAVKVFDDNFGDFVTLLR
tara:strand:- start:621 stop:845 length:225 start_codon:yes stop_codon:yes gene_type:complete